MGPAEAEAGRRCRLIPVEEMAEAAGGFVRAGRPRSRGGFPHDRVTPTGQKGDKSAEAFWRQLSLKEVHLSSCLKQNLFPPRLIRTVVGGREAG